MLACRGTHYCHRDYGYREIATHYSNTEGSYYYADANGSYYCSNADVSGMLSQELLILVDASTLIPRRLHLLQQRRWLLQVHFE